MGRCGWSGRTALHHEDDRHVEDSVLGSGSDANFVVVAEDVRLVSGRVHEGCVEGGDRSAPSNVLTQLGPAISCGGLEFVASGVIDLPSIHHVAGVGSSPTAQPPINGKGSETVRSPCLVQFREKAGLRRGVRAGRKTESDSCQ